MAKAGAVVYEYYKNEFAERCGKGALCGWFVLFLSGYAYGRILPAKGIYFRHVNGLTVENVTVTTYRDDARKDFIFDQIN
ncbi:MAG: hypothetical protein J6K86_06400 [Clostridia bacterium]|nr:hypothetical protein [Clostridia bacterium]